MIKIGNIQNCQLKIEKPSVIAIGKFGVLHKGHELLMKAVFTESNLHNLKPIIFSFAPSPALFFSKKKHSHGRIFSIAKTHQILGKFFGDGLLFFLQKFNIDFASIEPEKFIQILISKINLKAIVIGQNFSFGKDSKGEINMLKNLGKKYGFQVFGIDLYDSISTTYLRNLLQKGEIEKFNSLLAFDEKYEISGIVRKGFGIAGKKLNFKTANLFFSSKTVMPKFGVYSCIIENKFYGIANFGIKPTLFNVKRPILEVHIFDFNQNLYGKKIAVRLLKFIRDEKKFENIEELKKQIADDITKVKLDLM